MFWTEDVLRGGETIHFAEMLLKFRKQTTQNLQEASETDQIHYTSPSPRAAAGLSDKTSLLEEVGTRHIA